MSVSNFIPETWSARLLESLHKQLVFGALCNRNYEGEIRQYGDTVHINSLSDISVKAYTPNTDIDDPEQLSGTDRTLVIDHGAYCNFYLNDVDRAQARPDLLEAAMRGAARRLAEDTEAYVLSVIIEQAGITGTIAAGADMYESLIAIKTALDQNNVPRTGRKLVVPPTVEAELLKDSRFLTAGGSIAEHALADGAVVTNVGTVYLAGGSGTDNTLEITDGSSMTVGKMFFGSSVSAQRSKCLVSGGSSLHCLGVLSMTEASSRSSSVAVS